MGESVYLGARLPPFLRRKIEKEAAERGVPMSQVIRERVERSLDETDARRARGLDE